MSVLSGWNWYNLDQNCLVLITHCTDNPCVEYTEGQGKSKSFHLSIDVFINVTVMLASNDSPGT